MSFDEQDERFMLEAIELAKQCISERARDPKVGAVLVKNGHRIATAFRGQYPDARGDHAEYNLFHKNLENKSDACEATLYVTLEPCSDRSPGKTPCYEHVIAHGVSRVVIGCIDLNPRIATRGYNELRKAGIEVQWASSQIMDLLDKVNQEFLQYYESSDKIIERYLTDTQDNHDRECEDEGRRILLRHFKDMVYYFNNKPTFAMPLLGADRAYYTIDEIHLNWSSDEYEFPEALYPVWPRILMKLIEKAQTYNYPFYNGPCARLLAYRAQATEETLKSEKKHLWLTLGPVGWYDYSIANEWFSPILHSLVGRSVIGNIRQYVDLDNISRGGPLSSIKLSNIVSTATTLLTKDGYIIFSQRGQGVSASQGAYTCAVAENIHQNKDLEHQNLSPDSLNCPNPFYAVRRGLLEEVSRSLVQYTSTQNLLLLGISFDLNVFHPDLLFVVALPLDYNDLLEKYRQQRGEDFTEGRLIGVPCTLDNPTLNEYLYDSNWVPSGLASITRTIEFLKALASESNLDFGRVIKALCEEGISNFNRLYCKDNTHYQ